jgi:hypothetical protein
MNGKVAKMLRKTGRTTQRNRQHSVKRWWYSLDKNERGELRRDWNKLRAIQTAGTAKL